MKVNNFHQYRGFVICRGSLTRGDIFVNPNRASDGEYNQFFYGVAGEGTANNLPLVEGNLYDLSEFKDQEIAYTSTAPVSVWAAFNPILKGTRLDVRVIDQPTSEDIYSRTLETFIVPIEGSVEVNGQALEVFKSGRLLIGKTATLTVHEGSVCALVNVMKESG